MVRPAKSPPLDRMRLQADFPDTRDDRLLAHIECLVALAETRHFGMAARRLKLSQPAFSRSIKALEEACGAVIVRRTRRFEGLTQEGEIVLKHARRILDEVAKLRDAMTTRGSGAGWTIRLGSIPSTLVVATLLAHELRDRYPHASVQVQVATSAEVSQLLRDRELVASLNYSSAPGAEGSAEIELYDLRYQLITPERWSLANADLIDWRDAAAVPLGLLETGSKFREIVEQAFAAAGAKPNVVIESNSLMALAAEVVLDTCAAIVPATFTSSVHLPQGVRAVPLRTPIIRHSVCLTVGEQWAGKAMGEAILALGRAIIPTITKLA